MKKFLDLKYDKIKKKLYFLDKNNNPVFFNLEKKNGKYFIIPVDENDNPVLFLKYKNGIEIQKEIYDNINEKLNNIKINDQNTGSEPSQLEILERKARLMDELKTSKQKRKPTNHNFKELMTPEKPSKNRVEYKIYTNPDVILTNKDKPELERIFQASVRKRIKQQVIESGIYTVNIPEHHNIIEKNIFKNVKIFLTDIREIKPEDKKKSVKKQNGGNPSIKKKKEKEPQIRKGPQIGSKFFNLVISGNIKYVNENILTEKSELTAKHPMINDGKPIDFYVLLIRKDSKLQELFSDWNNTNKPTGKVVDKYIGEKQPDKRKKRFARSVNYLKNITERLRDCTDISVAYKKKHQEVESMIVTIRKLYGLIIFLRDQITRNQENYDTLERLILQIMIAMKQDYHIPEDELERLKLIQKRIADDGVELEKKFRIVSNQILDRLKASDALKEESPDHIGPDFPIEPDVKFENKTEEELDEAKKKVKPEDYIVKRKTDPEDETDFTKYFKKQTIDDGSQRRMVSTGEPRVEDPDPFKYTEEDFEKGKFGVFRRSDEAIDQLAKENDPDGYNQQMEDVHENAAIDRQNEIKESNKKLRKKVLERTKRKYEEQLGDDFVVELKNESDNDSERLLAGQTIKRDKKSKMNNKILVDALNQDEKFNLASSDGSLDIKQAGGKKNTFKKSVSQNKNTFKKNTFKKSVSQNKKKKKKKKNNMKFKNKYSKLKRKKNYYKKKYLMTKKLLNKYVKK